jgi:hypothetical protein
MGFFQKLRNNAAWATFQAFVRGVVAHVMPAGWPGLAVTATIGAAATIGSLLSALPLPVAVLVGFAFFVLFLVLLTAGLSLRDRWLSSRHHRKDVVVATPFVQWKDEFQYDLPTAAIIWSGSGEAENVTRRLCFKRLKLAIRAGELSAYKMRGVTPNIATTVKTEDLRNWFESKNLMPRVKPGNASKATNAVHHIPKAENAESGELYQPEWVHFGDRQSKASEIGRLYARAVALRNHAASLRVMDAATESEMNEIQGQLIINVRDISPEQTINLETLNIYDRKNHPMLFRLNSNRAFEFSEFLRRIQMILEKYQG